MEPDPPATPRVWAVRDLRTTAEAQPLVASPRARCQEQHNALHKSALGATSLLGIGLCMALISHLPAWQGSSTTSFRVVSPAGFGVKAQFRDPAGPHEVITPKDAQLANSKFKMDMELEQQKMQLEQGIAAGAMVQQQEMIRLVEAAEEAKGIVQKSHLNQTMRLHSGKLPKGVGIVNGLYTYGAPGTSIDPLYDATSPNGCIPGLRVYTKGTRFAAGNLQTFFQITDPVSWITNAIDLKHANMASFAALQGNEQKNLVFPCGTGFKEPESDGFFWVMGHFLYPKILQAHVDAFANSTVYPKVLETQLGAFSDLTDMSATFSSYESVQKELNRVRLMLHFAWANYYKTPLISVDAPDWGWVLVGRACATTDQGPVGGVLGLTLKSASVLDRTVRTYIDACQDHTLLFQHHKSLECVLSFEGSDDFLDWMANLNFATVDFCGLGKVHQGFRAKILRMVGGIDYSQVIRPKLKYCSSVRVSGHSLGGAQAELFTACVNRILAEGSPGYNEYRLVRFSKDQPKQLPAFLSDQVKGFFLRNKGNGMCMDVEGTMATDYQSAIILYPCEFPRSYAKDQQWDFTPEGLITNRLSGKCIDGDMNRNGGPTLKQWPCDATAATQKWTLTPEGFLLNKASGRCMDSHMNLTNCPYTDQRWELKADGHMVNKLSGLCLDVEGSPGTSPGSKLDVWHCEYYEKTDQLWELTPEGALRNKLSGLCANMIMKQGSEAIPMLALGKCDLAALHTTMSWEQMAGGFFKNAKNGNCLDVAGKPGIEPGSQVGIMPCEDRTVHADGLWKRMPGGFIRNVGHSEDRQNRCIDTKGKPWMQDVKLASGTPLVLSPCELNTDQKWEISSTGRLRSVIGGRKCVDVVPLSLKPAGRLWLMNCDGPSEPALFLDMKWEWIQYGGGLRNRLYRRCLEVAQDGFVHLSPCGEGNGTATGKQQWEFRTDRSIFNADSGSCLDVTPTDVLGSQKALVLKPCAAAAGPAGPTQEWELLPSGLLRNRYSQACTGVLPSSAVGDVGRVLAMKECPGSTQVWLFNANGQIKNVNTGKCIDSMEKSDALPWWELVSSDCDPLRKHQQWERVAG